MSDEFFIDLDTEEEPEPIPRPQAITELDIGVECIACHVDTRMKFSIVQTYGVPQLSVTRPILWLGHRDDCVNNMEYQLNPEESER